MPREADVIERLSYFLRLEAEMVRAYLQASLTVGDPVLMDRMRTYRDEHAHRMDEIGTMIRNLGGVPPVVNLRPGSAFKSGLTDIPDQATPEETLRAMERNETLCADRYQEALRSNLTLGPAEMMRKNFVEEETHLHVLRQALSDMTPWETSGGA